MAKTKTKPKKKESLPLWDLSHLVPAPARARIDKGLSAAQRAAHAFAKKYRDRLARLSPKAFGRAIAEYENILARMGRYYSYASLDRQTKLDDPKAGQLYQTVAERANAITTELLFFQLEINRLPQAALSRFLKDRGAARYRPWLDETRAFRAHQLPDEVEKAVHERSVTGHAAWSRMFDETAARLRFPVGRKMLTDTELFRLMSDRDAKKRKAATQAAEKVFGENIQAFGLILNTIAKDCEIDARQRGFKSPLAARNLGNHVEDEVVDALVKAVQASYPRLSHRYYRLKARWMGKKKLDIWDRNAPLPFSADRKIPWAQAKSDVLAAYGAFHPEMARIARRFFDEGWIDARPRPGKDSGAFSASTVPDAHPYILMNYTGRVDDVMTLAHELGHGIHQVLAAPQGYLMCGTPLTLAETASVFGEMLAFQSYLRRETSAKARKAVIANKVEDMLNTVVRQVAFHVFEKDVHEARRAGELSPAQIGAIWMKTARQSLGPAFRYPEGYRHFWAYIPHFYHVPFYVYAYAFGDCLVNALYAVYLESGDDFPEKYMDLLRAGGTKRHDALLKPFGLDARDPAFWKRGLSVIESLIDQLESA